MRGNVLGQFGSISVSSPADFLIMEGEKMLQSIDWQQAVHDPRFWALRYNGKFPTVTEEDYLSYRYEFYQLAALEDDDSDDDPLAGYAGEGDELEPEGEEAEIGWRTLSLPFPETYSWKIELVTEEASPGAAGIYHSLFHPDFSPKGFLLAEESGHPSRPGLRWTELKQIETCLARQGFSDFEVKAVIPLLYPAVWKITFDDLQDVRQTLATVWQDLQVLDSTQAEQWLDDILEVYEKGWTLHLDAQKEWKPYPFQKQPYPQREIWMQTEGNVWQTSINTSSRYTGRDAHQWLPFFSMLERYARDR